jgi:CO/xanthine dehydrogenase Mo-binding subunit
VSVDGREAHEVGSVRGTKARPDPDAYCAIAVEIETERDIGRIRVKRAVSTVDSGHVVNSRRRAQPDRGRHPAVVELDAL